VAGRHRLIVASSLDLAGLFEWVKRQCIDVLYEVRQAKARLASSGVTQTVFRAQSPRCSRFTCLLGSGSVPQGDPFPSNESRGHHLPQVQAADAQSRESHTGRSDTSRGPISWYLGATRQCATLEARPQCFCQVKRPVMDKCCFVSARLALFILAAPSWERRQARFRDLHV
jgi:hypothetical protein